MKTLFEFLVKGNIQKNDKLITLDNFFVWFMKNANPYMAPQLNKTKLYSNEWWKTLYMYITDYIEPKIVKAKFKDYKEFKKFEEKFKNAKIELKVTKSADEFEISFMLDNIEFVLYSSVDPNKYEI